MSISLKPSTFEEGGGLLDNADVEVTDARFALDDYGGKSDVKVPLCVIHFTTDENDEHKQFYSVGKADDFIPSDNGKGLVAIGTKAKLTKTSNFAMFMDSLVAAGFPENKIDDDDITCIVGTRCHVVRQAVKREGLAQTAGKRDQTVLVVDKIYQLPWDKATKNKSKAATKGKAEAQDKAEEPSGIEAAAESIILSVIVEGGGKVAKNKLLTAVLANDQFKALKQTDGREVVKLISSDVFLSGSQRWGYANGELSL